MRASASTSLHRAKLRRPATAEHHVRRPRLVELLDEEVRAPLTLVVAPAGTGKTSLMAGWTADRPPPTAWLSLDRNDRDVVQFWSGVIAALETFFPGCGERALTLLRRPGARVAALDQLLADLEAGPGSSAVVVIDDFHLVDDDELVLESLSRFVDEQPAWLSVVLMSRREPHLPLNRMRSRGQLGELRFAELRFSPDEAVELLTRLAPTLSSERIEAAVRRADGWATSLQLSALAARSLRAQATPAPGHHDDVLIQDYVLHEVLGNETAELIDLLSAVAVVSRVNQSLAHALTGRPDAGELLSSAEARGLFLTRRGSGGWFELHALVRGVLTEQPSSRSADLHARAARWYEAEGEVVEAVDHWLLAGRQKDALRLLSAHHGRLYDSGREATVKRALAAIPAAVAVDDLGSMIDYAWCHLLVDRRRFVELVEQLTWWVERSRPNDTVRARVKVLRGAAAVVGGRWVEGGALNRQALRELGEGGWRDPFGRFAANGIAREIAYSERWDDAADEVRETELALSRDHERRIAFEGTRAIGEALAGHPLDALRISAGVRRIAQVTDMTILRAELAVAEAVARRELGDRARALAELEALAAGPAETMLFCRILAMCELAHEHLAMHDVETARRIFARAETLVLAESLGPDVCTWLHRLGTVLALADGDLDGARRWAEQVDDSFWRPVGEARIHLVAGDRPAALAALDPAVPRCDRHDVVLALCRARAVPDRDEAMKGASVAVELASAHGMLQTVVSEGAEVIELVERAAWRAPPPWLDRLRRAAADVPDRPSSGSGPIEPLTDRELDVLRFLPSRLTVREIAGELHISVNTVKFHLRVIYRKLGVSSRGEAAAIARARSAVR